MDSDRLSGVALWESILGSASKGEESCVVAMVYLYRKEEGRRNK